MPDLTDNGSSQPRDVEDYIHQMATELAKMAADHRLSTLQYLLSLVAEEAAGSARARDRFH